MSKYKSIRGFNDIYNTEYKIGKYIKDIIIEISESYNYKQVELAEMEYTSLYSDFYSSKVEESLFSINNRYSSSVSLRYDGLISLFRSIIENQLYIDKSLPIKLMANTKEYRFNKLDRKEKACYEKFVFVNALFDDYHVDLENINLALDVFYALGMEDVDLILYKNKLSVEKFNNIKKELKETDIYYRDAKANKKEYDGLAYEFYYNDALVAYGGRHDDLSNKLQAPEFPSSSLEFDIDELKNMIEFTSLAPGMEEELDFLVVSTDKDFSSSLKVASRLRELGVKVDISYNDYDVKRLGDFIDRINIPYTLIINHADVNKGIVRVRNSISKDEGDVYFEEFLQDLIEHSKHHHE